MSLYPIPRQTRESNIIAGDGRATYGPFAFKVWDVVDVLAEVLRPGGAWHVENVAVAKVANQDFDDFTVTFSPALSAGTQAVVYSARLHERSMDVIRGGAVSGAALERELSKQATVIQELRRDVNRRMEEEDETGYSRDEVDQLLAARSPVGHTHVMGDVAGLSNALAGKQNSLPSTPEFAANKGQAGGYAGLDGSGKVPAAQLPAAQTVDAYTKAQTDTLVGARQLTSQKGQANGYAALDGDGKVPVSQLPVAPSGSTDAKDIIFYPTPSIAVPVAQRLGQEVVLTDGYTSGLTDFSDLFQANLERARDTGRPLRIPGGRFTLNRRFTLTTDKPITITGDGKLLSHLFWPAGSASDGLQFIATVDDAGGLFEDFGLVTRLDCLNTALGFNLAQQAVAIGGAGDTLVVDRMRPRCDVRSIYMAGDDNVDAYGFLNGFTCEMALQVRVTDCTFVGRRLNQYNYKSNRAFNLGTATNKGHPVESYVDRCAAYYVTTAVRFEGMEGMFARGNHAVYVDTGYEAVDSTGRPHFECVGNHANFNLRGVAVDGVREARVEGNSLYHQGPTSKAGVAIAVGGTACQNASINDNFIVNGIDTTGQLAAIDVYNCDHGKIDGNQVIAQVPGRGAQGRGITLAGSARFMIIGANNVFPKADSGRQILEYNINDQGVQNVTGAYGSSGGSSVAGRGARYRKSGDQGVSAGSLNIITFQSQEDVLGSVPDMSGGVFTVPYAGLWSFHANVQTSGQSGAATTVLNIQYNATSGNAIAITRVVTAENEIINVSLDTGPRRCNAGDEIRVGINTSIARSVLAVVNTSFEARQLA